LYLKEVPEEKSLCLCIIPTTKIKNSIEMGFSPFKQINETYWL
jgi:hypothetical protein